MEEPVLFSLWKISVPYLECLTYTAAWRLGEFLLVLAYSVPFCLEREMGLLWAPCDCATSESRLRCQFLQSLATADFSVPDNADVELNINVLSAKSVLPASAGEVVFKSE